MSKITNAQRVKNWYKDHSRIINLRLNKVKEADIIAHLEKQDNMSGYIIDLIRADIIAKGGELKDTTTLKDISRYMIENELIRIEFITGTGTPTIWFAKREEIANDTRVVKEWRRDRAGNLSAKVKVR